MAPKSISEEILKTKIKVNIQQICAPKVSKEA